MKLFFLNLLLLVGVSSCSSSVDEEEFFNEEKESMSIYVYKDVAFTHNDSARFFSTSTGALYSKENVKSIKAVSETVDLISTSSIWSITFKGPSNTDSKVSTKVQHWGVKMTNEEFDAITNKSSFDSITIKNDNTGRGIGFKGIFLFETIEGKKGAIKVRKFNLKRVLVDIKVMK